MADDDLDYQRPEQFSRVPDLSGPSGLFTPSSLMPQQFTLPTDKSDTSGGIPTVLGDKIDQTAFLKAQGLGDALTKADKDAMDAMTKQNEELQSIVKRQIEARQQFMRDAQKLRADRPQLPKQQDIPSAPTERYRNPFEAFSSPAVMLGMLASLFTRQPLTVAFNSAAAALKGYHEGDKELFDQETANWKRNVDVALKQNQKELDVYNAAWNQHKENFHDMLSEFEARAAGFKDEQMLTLLKYAGPKEIWEMLQHRIEAQQKVEEGRLRVEKEKAEIEKLHAQAEQIQKGGVSDEQIEDLVDRRMAGDASVEVGLKRGYSGPATWARYQAALADRMRAENVTPQDLLHITQRAHAEGLGLSAEARTAGSMTTRVENAVNELTQTIPLALQSSRNLPRGTFVPFNRLYQAWQAGTSDPAYNDFITRNLAVVNAYARAMNPQGIPRIAERAENHALGILSTATSQQAYEVQLRALWAEAQASKKATAMTQGEIGNPPQVGGFPGGESAAAKSSGAPFVVPPGFSAVEVDKAGKPVTPPTETEATQNQNENPDMVPSGPGLPIGGF